MALRFLLKFDQFTLIWIWKFKKLGLFGFVIYYFIREKSKSDTVDPIHTLNCTTFFTDLLPVLNGKKAETNTEDFLQEVFDILMEYIKKSNDRNNKILDFHQPEQILETMDFSLPDKPQNLDQILVDCKDALKYQVKTGKLGSNQLWST